MEANGLMKYVLSSHEIILSAEPLGKFEAEVPKRLHPVEQKQGRVEFSFTQGKGSFPEYDELHDETKDPKQDSRAKYHPRLHKNSIYEACDD